MGEFQETLHHLSMAFRKGYLTEGDHQVYRERYLEAARMLRGLERSLMTSRRKLRGSNLLPNTFDPGPVVLGLN